MAQPSIQALRVADMISCPPALSEMSAVVRLTMSNRPSVSTAMCRLRPLSLRNLSPATQRSYIHAVKRFSQYHGRSPDRLGLDDVRAFQVYLVSQGVSWGALNQTVCALRFFYGVTFDRAEIPERIAYARTRRKLPAILSADEVVRFLEAVSSLKARAALVRNGTLIGTSQP